MTFDQIMIFLCSGGSIFFLSGKRPIIGFALGLLGQPFWFYTAWVKWQPAILLLAFWFTFCHARGLRRQWLELMANREIMNRLDQTLAEARAIRRKVVQVEQVVWIRGEPWMCPQVTHKGFKWDVLSDGSAVPVCEICDQTLTKV